MASISSAFRARNRSRTAGWLYRRQWARPTSSIFSPPAAAERRSPAISLIAKEVNPVLKALREHGIEVTAIHNHMLDDEPHLYFMHFWANDDAGSLAEGLKAALALINIAKS